MQQWFIQGLIEKAQSELTRMNLATRGSSIFSRPMVELGRLDVGGDHGRIRAGH
jgi:hypothetical protein